MSADPVRSPVDGLPTLSDMASSYDAYFASGLYQDRYPAPNRRTLRILRQCLPQGGFLLDYGAGEGRYCFALAREKAARVVAVDISAVAREHLTKTTRSLGLAGQVDVCDADDAFYRDKVTGTRWFDVALLGFGVLGHVAGRASRLKLLSELRSSLADEGRLILGLPNATRRFRALQSDGEASAQRHGLEPGDIRYRRHSGAGDIALFYHLFRRDEIVRDLTEAGFAVECLTVESLLPERAVTHSPLLGWIDDLACGLVPVDWGYGYLVVARSKQ